MINNSFFENNKIQGHLIDISKTLKINFKNVFCLNNNQNPSPNEKLLMGGCFRTRNIISRNFESIRIFSCFSGKTSVGIKIIDESQEIEYLKNYFTFAIDSQVFCFVIFVI